MTVGYLFLIIVSVILVWFNLAYTLYKTDRIRVEETDTGKTSKFLVCVLVSFLILLLVFIISTIIYQLIINWNVLI